MCVCVYIFAFFQVLILEESFGLVLASVFERLGGYGQVCSASSGNHTSMDMLRFFNFEERVTSIGRLAKVSDLRKARESITSGGVREGVEKSTQQQTALQDDSTKDEKRAEKKQKIEKENGTVTLDEKKVETGAEHNKQKSANFIPRRKVYFPKWSSEKERQEMVAKGFSSLIVVAPKYSPESVIDKLACLLAPSATFAIFSPWLQVYD